MVCATITPLLKGAFARWKRKSDVHKPPQGGCAQVKILWRTSRNQMGRCCRNNELIWWWPEIFATLYAMQSTINTMNEYCTEPQSQETSCNFLTFYLSTHQKTSWNTLRAHLPKSRSGFCDEGLHTELFSRICQIDWKGRGLSLLLVLQSWNFAWNPPHIYGKR